ncbi:ABC transporter substrate-binding protein [Paenibacillus wenxiniae]|uniref:ABC transporter substrate-binding protein n=1 Tax=Paenibacillus wenxiniae TaxID=1636843 RepID=A0ABW4REA6_9BACL
MKVQFGFKHLLIGGVCAVLLAGCGQTTSSNSSASANNDNSTIGSIVIQHDMGTTELKQPATHVVALEWSFVDDLLALGITPVGIADDDKPKAMEKLAGKPIEYMPLGKRETPDLEKIAGVAPDLIIADTDRHSKIKDQLDQIAPTIVLNSRKGSYEDSIKDFETIAKSVGKEAEAKERLVQHDKMMAVMKKQVEALPEKRVLVGVARKGDFNAHSTTSYAGEVLNDMGFDNVIQGSEKEPYKEVNLETITAMDPDIIFIATDDSEVITNEWKKLPVWQNLKAVKNHHVYMVDRDIWTRFRGITPAEKIGQSALDYISGKLKSES